MPASHWERSLKVCAWQATLAACTSVILRSEIPRRLPLQLYSDTAITGLDNITAGTSYGGISVIAGTDVIAVREAVATNSTLTAALASTAAPIVVASNPTNIAAGSILLISDCNSADMFKVSSITGSGPYTIAHATTSNTSASFLSAYNTDAQLMTYTQTTFFIGNTGRINLQGAAIPALFRTTMAGTTEELVEGVENMQITYGLDADNNQTADSYVTAAGVSATNWHNVVSLRLDLLVNSVDGVSPTPVAYNYAGGNTTPTDRLLRHEFITVINLRNNTP